MYTLLKVRYLECLVTRAFLSWSIKGACMWFLLLQVGVESIQLDNLIICGYAQTTSGTRQKD